MTTSWDREGGVNVISWNREGVDDWEENRDQVSYYPVPWNQNPCIQQYHAHFFIAPPSLLPSTLTFPFI
ncbi:hypothetical protein L1887_02631 [Cichorium endivia]|nr:hypothetical protein L1887_02631 [Cichorium endivia]